MKRILNLLLLLMATTSSVTAAEDITLSVSDIVFDWGGWGGQANARFSDFGSDAEDRKSVV